MVKKSNLKIIAIIMVCISAFTNIRAQTHAFSESFDQWPFDPAWAFNVQDTTREIFRNRNVNLIASPTRLGAGAVRLTVFPGDTASKRNRAEINLFHNDSLGREVWYGWSFLVPEDYPDRPDNQLFQIMGQFHDAPDTSKGETWQNYPAHGPLVSMNYGTDNGQSGIQLNYGVNRTIDGVVYSRQPVSSATIEVGNSYEEVALSPATSVGVEPIAPTGFYLLHNYPNPFNPATTISYQLSAVSKVELTIYDITSRRVCTMVRSRQNAGLHKVIWDGRDDYGQVVASGIYLYKLVASRQIQIRRMALLR